MAVIGRPSSYSAKIVVEICDRLSDGQSLRRICRDPKMPTKKTVLSWLQSHPEFVTQYAMAKDECADGYAEDIIDIADDAMKLKEPHQVQAARLRIDARKWIASKLKPKKYGERMQTEVTGTMSLEQIVATTAPVKESPEQQP